MDLKECDGSSMWLRVGTIGGMLWMW